MASLIAAGVRRRRSAARSAVASGSSPNIFPAVRHASGVPMARTEWSSPKAIATRKSSRSWWAYGKKEMTS
ncbi:MAG: hypothetical protein OXC06_17820 [Acidimicrobiaceae bacterium]|nr:hypothetical protein [Acidimicrobiaceae bacterium]